MVSSVHDGGARPDDVNITKVKLADTLTSHGLWNIHSVSTFLGIQISQDAVVDEFPAKCVGNINNDAFWWSFWLSNISVKSVNLHFLPFGHGIVCCALEARGARHDAAQAGQLCFL
jgi:hypothetical protein